MPTAQRSGKAGSAVALALGRAGFMGQLALITAAWAENWVK